MYNPIQEKRNEICNNIAKSFGNVSEPEDIEKAKWQIEIREHTVGRGLNLKRAILINNSWDMLKNKPNKYN